VRAKKYHADAEDAVCMEQEEVKKKLEKAAKEVEGGLLERKMKYEKAEETLGERNSYSKTDEEATFMHLKEDHMQNGQTKPAYNLQTAVEDGFAIGYGVFSNPGDTRTLKPFLREEKELLGVTPKAVITDGGYGSEENYQYLEDEGITAVVKYSGWKKERSKKFEENQWNTANWEYNEGGKYYVCPSGKHLVYTETKEKENHSGYKVSCEVYVCESCAGCKKRKLCTGPKGERRIEYNENWNRLKAKACVTLESEEYRPLSKRRSQECETVHGQIKGNQGYRRFLLRGKKKVGCEWGLLLLGYNIRRLQMRQEKQVG
jgi:hypothetical protein